MTSKKALELYKSRDTSEKLFRGDKSYLGNKSLRVQTDETQVIVEKTKERYEAAVKELRNLMDKNEYSGMKSKEGILEEAGTIQGYREQ